MARAIRIIIRYLLRLVAYAVLLGLASRFAQWQWTAHNLDDISALQPIHDAGIWWLWFAPVVLAAIAWRRLAPIARFVACALIGAAVTAPYAFARLGLL